MPTLNAASVLAGRHTGAAEHRLGQGAPRPLLVGTQLRLRVVEEPSRDPVLKWGQKIRIEGESPMVVAHTTTYLDRADYDALVVLPGAGSTRPGE
jgi:hypothetical protein